MNLPGVIRAWHGHDRQTDVIVNFPDQVYDAAHPDEHRAPYDTPTVPYDWNA